MTLKPTVRLHLYFASENATAVVLRQGPKKLNRLILWNRDTDEFVDGQWLKHAVYPERCDLSPDGRYFLYFALNGKWSSDTKGSYTALSAPPFFTALSLFPVGDTWAGGGAFVNNAYFLADGEKDILNHTTKPQRIVQKEFGKSHSTIFVEHRTGQPAKVGKARIKAAVAKRQNLPDVPTDYLAKGSKLFRITDGTETLIRDFEDMSFEPIEAPYDQRPIDQSKPHPSNWHPLDEANR